MALDDIFRNHWGRVLATLVGVFRDIELAEDAAQEAFAIAAERWPRDGEPDNPVGWLISTARNRAIDHIRRQRVLPIRPRCSRASSTWNRRQRCTTQAPSPTSAWN